MTYSRSHIKWQSQNLNSYLQTPCPISSSLVASQGLGSLVSKSYCVWQICYRHKNFHLLAPCTFFMSSFLWLSCSSIFLIYYRSLCLAFSKSLVVEVPKLPLALTCASWIAGRHSITVTTLTSAGSIGEDGILSCTFEPDIKLSDIVIQWLKEGVMGLVHEFKEGKDDLSDQDEMFRGRTSVFADQVIVGNASLRLKNVQLTDAGTYKCYIITSKGKGNANLEYKTGGELLLEKQKLPRYLGLKTVVCWWNILLRSWVTNIKDPASILAVQNPHQFQK